MSSLSERIPQSRHREKDAMQTRLSPGMYIALALEGNSFQQYRIF